MPKQSRNDEKSTTSKKDPKKTSKNPPTKKTVKKTDAAADTDEKGKRGAKSQFANKVLPYLDKIEYYVHYGVSEGDVCKFFGVGKTQWAQYKKDYPELTETLYRAREAQKGDLIDNAYRVAMGYYYEEVETSTVIIDGKPHTKTKTVRKYSKPDAGMLQFLLINRFTAEFARDPQAVALRKKALELAEQGKFPPDGWEGV